MPSSIFDEHFEANFTLETESTPLREDMPFHLLMLGNWEGNSNFSLKSLSDRKFTEIDRDSFDDVMRRITPQLILNFDADTSVKLTFECLDDFHPDSIFQRVSLFSDLRKIRQDLKKADTFDAAAREVRSWYTDSKSKIEVYDNDSVPSRSSFEEGDLLEQILSNKPFDTQIARDTSKSALSEFVGNIVAPHVVKTDFTEQSKLLLIVDEVISDLMRKILHHEDFQQLESAWRGLFFLVRRVETSSKLKIFFIHLTKSELTDNLSSVSNLRDTDFYKWLVGNSPLSIKGISWSAACGNYEFGQNVESIAALMRISKIAEAAKCPFVSQITPEIFGAESFENFSEANSWKINPETSEYKLWSALRVIPESSYLGISLPSFMGRIPYGSQTESTELFSFEEFNVVPKHTEFLWVNSCFAYAYALTRQFCENGWNINQNNATVLDDLPLYFYELDESMVAKSCTEIDMTERLYNAIITQGITPLISFKGEDKIRLSAIRSISHEDTNLRGKW